jgi:transcriptional regulator with XRE-family HTH domain
VQDDNAHGVDLATLLRLELEARHWTQTDLEHELGARPGLTSRWLRGQTHPDPRHCVRIARALDLDPLEVLRLAGYIDPPQPPPPDLAREIQRRLLDRQFDAMIRTVDAAHWPTVQALVTGWLDGLASTIRRIERLH